jgi:hypothetical protein
MLLAGAGIRRRLRPSAACGARVGAAESFVSFIPLFDGMQRPPPLVVNDACSSLRNVPQDATRIRKVQHAMTPGLDRWRLWRANAKPLRQIQLRDVDPPRIGIVDHELHHAVLGPLLLIPPLQDEACRAHPEDRHVVAIEKLVEPKRSVELL